MTEQNKDMMINNPLLDYPDLPPFSAIRPEHIIPVIDHLLAQNRQSIIEVLGQNTKYTWDNLVSPLEEIQDRLNRSWSPVSHLHSVADNAELRSAYNVCLTKLSDYSTDVMQNHDLYLAYRQIADSDEYPLLNHAQQKIVDNTLRDFHLSGVTLNDKQKIRFREIEQTLAKIQAKFEENVLDATHAWTRHITDLEKLKGLPKSAIELAAMNAKEKGLSGWLITLDFPSYHPVMQYAEDPELREDVYFAYVTRASDQCVASPELDNSENMKLILESRRLKAGLLGFKTYAHYSLSRKMAGSPEEVMSFLSDLCDRSRPVARAEFDELKKFAEDRYNITDLNAWDIAYYSEKLREFKFSFSQEDLKPYFPVTTVIAGLFTLVARIYGLVISENRDIDTWHPDVQFFEIRDEAGVHRGSFYIDLYARAHKRGGAWMDECIVRKKTAERLQRPVAYLNCNFTPMVNNQPSLLTHDEVTTLFHEFGHGLHHMLTLVDYPGVSGINGVPWDAVELPSQLMENWCWERELLDVMARHYQTGEALPDDLYRKLMLAKNFQSGMQMLRQLEFALFDFRLHYELDVYDSESVQKLLNDVRSETGVFLPPAFNRFQHSFTHIFAGEYAAGYYSYKWAEVLSADAFSKFEEKGIFDRETGELFLHKILEQGGSRDPMELFTEFRGRKPSIDPLLRHSGITVESTGFKI